MTISELAAHLKKTGAQVRLESDFAGGFRVRVWQGGRWRVESGPDLESVSRKALELP